MENKTIKIAIIFGTRPEIIKLAPVILELRKFSKTFEVITISSGQHKEMLGEFLRFFEIKPDYELDVMTPDQDLFDINRRILTTIQQVLETEKPDLVLVQGDTLTAFTAAVSAFYLKIPVGHVEAGLRTFDKYSPYPEEMSRQLIDILTDIYFVPTKEARNNLLSEGKSKSKIIITGNTDIDALDIVLKIKKTFENKKLHKINFRKEIILVTCHRRESFGRKMGEIFQGLREVVENFPDVEIVYPVHLNPNIKTNLDKFLKNHPRIHILSPLGYSDMVNLMKASFLVATDSGGLQEEAPFLNKPVVVLRDKTERIEGLQAGTLIIGGTTKLKVFEGIKKVLTDKVFYQKMAKAKNPYGDGKASLRIRKAILDYFKK